MFKSKTRFNLTRRIQSGQSPSSSHLDLWPKLDEGPSSSLVKACCKFSIRATIFICLNAFGRCFRWGLALGLQAISLKSWVRIAFRINAAVLSATAAHGGLRYGSWKSGSFGTLNLQPCVMQKRACHFRRVRPEDNGIYSLLGNSSSENLGCRLKHSV